MPVHDWTRVTAGTFHDFHNAWITELRNVLNTCLLPEDYYAQMEQVAGEIGPDVLTLQEIGFSPDGSSQSSTNGGVTTVVSTFPQTRFSAEAEVDLYAKKRRSLIIRHGSEDRIVAIIEILSPGNKSSHHGMAAFLNKTVGAILRGRT